MPKKTSKTAHVLNLLSPTTDEEILADTLDIEGLSEDRTPVQNTTGTAEEPVEKSDSIEDILHISNSNDELSLLIKENLEKEFAESTGNVYKPEHAENQISEENKESESSTASSDASEQTEDLYSGDDTISFIENMLMEDLEESPKQEADLSPAKNNAYDDDLPDNIADILAGANMVRSVENVLAGENLLPQEDDSTYQEVIENTPFYCTNIFEHIVKDCTVEYMKRFELCTCDRCIADVAALALTNLPPKYMVTDYENVAPLIHFLEHKHEVILMTEMTKACLTVHAEPRHKVKKVKISPKTT